MTKLLTLCLLWLLVLFAPLTYSSEPWPGEGWWESENLTSLDNDFTNNLSGAHWNPVTRTLWVCTNGPAKFWAITENASGDFDINFQDGVRGQFVVNGDIEGITQVDYRTPSVYLMNESTEEIVHYNVSDYANVKKVQTWNIGQYIPSNGGAGPEGITFVPDEWLVKHGFVDNGGRPYRSQNGMGGLMFVAHQNGGRIYVFDLDPESSQVNYVGNYYTSRGESSGLEFDRSTGYLFIWHNTDGNRLEVSDLSSYDQGDGSRRLTRLAQYYSPKGGNLEGVALTPSAAKEHTLFFVDDDNQDGHALMAFNQFKPLLAVADTYSIPGDQSLVAGGIGVLANDYSGSQAILVSAPRNGVLNGLTVGDTFDGGFNYTPNAEYEGVDGFSYSIDGVQVANVSIDVTAVIIPEPEAEKWTLASSQQIALRSSSGKYLSAQQGGGSSLKASASMIDTWETFTLLTFTNGKVRLQASNGDFVVTENGGGSKVNANRAIADSWENFTLINLGNNKIALQAFNGQYLTAEGDGSEDVHANRDTIGSWETFTLQTIEQVAIQTTEGYYLVAEGGGGGVVKANRTEVGSWETFTLINYGDNQVSLQAKNGDFVVAENGGGAGIRANRPHRGRWETFTLIDQTNGTVALKAANGQYMVAERNSGRDVYANRYAVGSWEKFILVPQ